MAEWLRSGLQIREPRFDSGRGLQLHARLFSCHRPKSVCEGAGDQTLASRTENQRMTLRTADHSGPDMKHGGEPPFANADRLSDWVDLSTGINPHSYTVSKLTSADWERLPSQSAHDELLSAARHYYAIPDFIGAVAVPGTEAAIHQLPDLCPGPIAIIEPTYSSHRAAWAANGSTTYALDDLPSGVVETHLLVVNPNNPTGHLTSPEALVAIAKSLAPGRYLIVDEAFMDCQPEMSVVPYMQDGLPIIVLKSFGKFFGLAGLRLGFVIGNSILLKELSGRFGDWCISGPALKIGCAALSDSQWQTSMRVRLKTDMDRLESLTPQPDQMIGRTDLFLTCRHRNAVALHSFLATRKIWTRSFAYEPSWLRFGLPKSDAEFERFASSLSAFAEQAAGA